MPWGDRTGPAGLGPMTGRSAGYCAGYSVPGYLNPIPGRGFYGVGRGGYPWGGGRSRAWGGGRGWGGRGGVYGAPYGDYSYPQYTPVPTPKEEESYLKEELSLLEDQIKSVKERLKVVEKEGEKAKK